MEVAFDPMELTALPVQLVCNRLLRSPFEEDGGRGDVSARRTGGSFIERSGGIQRLGGLSAPHAEGKDYPPVNYSDESRQGYMSDTTIAEENARIATEYFDGAMNDNEFDESVLSDDFTAQMGSHAEVTLDDVKANIEGAHEALPDRTVDIEDVVATADDVVIRWRLTGTHTGGPYLDIEATGEEIDAVGFIQFRFEDGQIVEAWSLSDTYTLLRQLGAIETPDD